jgi:hypothetical protein
MIGETGEGSEGSPSADGQCSFNDLRVESRTSNNTSYVSAWSCRSAQGVCAPGESIVISVLMLTSPIYAKINAAAVKLPGTITPLPGVRISAQISFADTEELQSALGVGPTVRSTAGDLENAKVGKQARQPTWSEQRHVGNKFAPASSQRNAMDGLAAAVMFSQSHPPHAGRGALTCDESCV